MMLVNIEDDKNSDGLTFEAWKAKVDNAISDATGGLTLDDLPDQDTWDAWDSATNPVEFAGEVLINEGVKEEEG